MDFLSGVQTQLHACMTLSILLNLLYIRITTYFEEAA